MSRESAGRRTVGVSALSVTVHAGLLAVAGEAVRARRVHEAARIIVEGLHPLLAAEFAAILGADDLAGERPWACVGRLPSGVAMGSGNHPDPSRVGLALRADGETVAWLMLGRREGFSRETLQALAPAADTFGETLAALAHWQQLTAAEAIFRSLFEFLPVPALVVRDQQVVAVNPALCRLTGLAEADLREGGLATILTGPDSSRLGDRGVVALWPAGGLTPVRLRAVLGPYPPMPGARVMVLLTDDEATGGLDSLTAGLAGGVAHSFNNLLQTVVGYASLGQSKAGPQAPQLTYFAAIEQAGQEMARLTADLVAYARVGLVQPEPLAFDELVTRAVSPFVSSDRLALQLSAPTAVVAGDRQQLELVVHNLVSNAVEASPTPGLVTLTTALVDDVESGPGDAGIPPRPGRYVRLRVVDQGPGIDPAAAATVFRPFVSSHGPGRGLGLAAVEGVCLHHGGGVVLHSQPGVGTTVDAYLPLATPG